MKKLLSLCLLISAMCFLSIEAHAQYKQVSGQVVEATTGWPIVGATVWVKGTTIGTLTDIDGYFTLTCPAICILQFSFIGMKTVEVPTTHHNVFYIVMEEDAEMLDDVVVYTTPLSVLPPYLPSASSYLTDSNS